MKRLRFYKTEQDKWFVDLPAYIEAGGPPEALEMVLGADTLLSELSEGKDHIVLNIATKYMEFKNVGGGISTLKRADNVPCYDGTYYKIGWEYDKYLWLCPVMLWLFNEYPPVIYFQSIYENDKKDS